MTEENKFASDEFFNKAIFFWGLENAGDVPAVRNQREKDNCYAHAVTNALFTDVKRATDHCFLGSIDELTCELTKEKAKQKKKNKKKEKPCFADAFDYILKNGLSLETDYVKSGNRKRKSTNEKHKKITIEDYEWVKLEPDDEKEHNADVIGHLQKQPLAASMDCTWTFKYWNSDGIYSHTDAEYDEFADAENAKDVVAENVVGHAVTIFGYGMEDGVPYYIILNSWGEDWGHGGFAKVSPSIITEVFFPIGTDYKMVA